MGGDQVTVGGGWGMECRNPFVPQVNFLHPTAIINRCCISDVRVFVDVEETSYLPTCTWA